MSDPQTTKMSVLEILKWIESHETNPELTTICPANFFTSVKHWFTVSRPDIWSLAAERDDLLRWKSEAMQVMGDLDLQAIGKEMDLKLGSNIAPEILPYIRKLKGNAP